MAGNIRVEHEKSLVVARWEQVAWAKVASKQQATKANQLPGKLGCPEGPIAPNAHFPVSKPQGYRGTGVLKGDAILLSQQLPL